MEQMKEKGLESAKYEQLYERIQDMTNDINNFCGFAKMSSSVYDDYALQMMDKLQDLSNQLSNTAHELEEYLAWN